MERMGKERKKNQEEGEMEGRSSFWARLTQHRLTLNLFSRGMKSTHGTSIVTIKWARYHDTYIQYHAHSNRPFDSIVQLYRVNTHTHILHITVITQNGVIDPVLMSLQLHGHALLDRFASSSICGSSSEATKHRMNNLSPNDSFEFK